MHKLKIKGGEKMNREDMCKIANEINKELGASIKVNTKSTFAGLMEGITEAVENFEGKAVLSQKTIDFLCEKEIDVPAQIKVKSKAASGKPAKEKKEKAEKSPSNKWIIYQAWKKGEKESIKLYSLIHQNVKETTIKSWISQWNNGKNLPAGI